RTDLPEYTESVYASFKAGMASVNTHCRYAADELVYLWDYADVIAVVFHGSFVPDIEAVRHRLPRIAAWFWVDDGSHPCPDWASPYEVAATNGRGRTIGPGGRSGDHLFLLYPAGTTAMPKGGMWRRDAMSATPAAPGPRTPLAHPPRPHPRGRCRPPRAGARRRRGGGSGGAQAGSVTASRPPRPPSRRAACTSPGTSLRSSALAPPARCSDR